MSSVMLSGSVWACLERVFRFAWTWSPSPKTSYSRALWVKDLKLRGFGALRPHCVGNLDAEEKLVERCSRTLGLGLVISKAP